MSDNTKNLLILIVAASICLLCLGYASSKMETGKCVNEFSAREAIPGNKILLEQIPKRKLFQITLIGINNNSSYIDILEVKDLEQLKEDIERNLSYLKEK